MKRERLTWKRWAFMNEAERNLTNAKLKKWQSPNECEYGFNSAGDIISILDFGALANMFSITKVTVK